MADHRDLAAFDWVAVEIEASLSSASDALERYVEGAGEQCELRQCSDHVIAARGALLLLELPGAALFLAEAASVLRAIMDGECADAGEAAEFLTTALLGMPVYLQKVRASRDELPGLLLPGMNQMRAARGESLLTGLVLFAPDLSSLSSASTESSPSATMEPEAFRDLLKTQRQTYQLALVGIIRNQEMDNDLLHLLQVCRCLGDLSEGTAQSALWESASALVEGLANNSLRPDMAIKSLLKALDLELRSLLSEGWSRFEQAVPASLLKGILFYVAQANPTSAQMRRVKEKYALDEALRRIQFDGAGQPEPKALNSVVLALTEELGGIKQLLDHQAHEDDFNPDVVAECLPLLQRLSDTLAMLGFPALVEQLRRQIRELESVLAGCFDSAAARESVFIEVASELLAIEHALLDDLQFTGCGRADDCNIEVHGALTCVVTEALKVCNQLRESVLGYIDSQWEPGRLAGVSQALKSLCAALSLVGFSRVEQVLRDCESYVSEHLSCSAVAPSADELDALADVISGVSYYFELFLLDREGEREAVLDLPAASAMFLRELAEQEHRQQHELSRQPAAQPMADAEGLPESEPRSVAEINESFAGGDEAAEIDSKPSGQASETSLPAVEAPDAALSGQGPDLLEELADPEIAEIFFEEAEEVLQTIRTGLEAWQSGDGGADELTVLCRAWHTLKGGGRMVGALVLADLASDIETLLNRCTDGAVEKNDALRCIVEQAAELTIDLVAELRAGRPIDCARVEQLSARVQGLLSGDSTPPARHRTDDRANSGRLRQRGAAAVRADAEDGDSTVSALPGACADSAEPQSMADMLLQEASEHLQRMRAFVDQARAGAEPARVNDSLLTAIHGLSGSAQLAEAAQATAILEALAQLVKLVDVSGRDVGSDLLLLLEDVTGLLSQLFDQSVDQRILKVEAGALIERIDAMNASIVAAPGSASARPQRVHEFLLEVDDRLSVLAEILASWPPTDAQQQSACESLEQHTRAIAAGAGSLQFTPLARLADQWHTSIAQMPASTIDRPVIQLFEQAHSSLVDMCQCLAADQCVPGPDAGLMASLEAIAGGAAGSAPHSDDLVVATEIDEDILEIFLDEAGDILESVDDALRQWAEDTREQSHPELLKRHLHTLKGGARLAGLPGLGDLSHDFESFLIEADDCGVPIDDDFFSTLQAFQDRAVAAVDALLARDLKQPQSRISPPAARSPAESGELELGGETIAMVALDPGLAAPVEPVQAPASDAQDVIKMPAQLVDDLVNLAGETSINRSRVEEQINDLIFSLSEMDATVNRMQEQLRRLDRETEAQLVFRQEQLESQGLEGFDPLEMDRYSVLQQLSRSLMESSSDIQEVRRVFYSDVKDIESLLVQQARINTSLQEGLMQSRMAPFSRIAPRLRRIVRQVSGELDKKVKLELPSSQGHMDRTLLDHMVPPFEHMLRNAVDHGIENPEERLARGKPQQATIAIGLSRQAGNSVITVQDDGRGIDLDAVKAKAVERGLLAEGVSPTDREILQFILMPGFSTAASVTQISGRGVGLDVVASDIQQLGGTIDIDSKPGQGTRFTVQLPFTVSVNRALMVRTVNRQFALPLNTIEGIVRISPFELEAYYQPDAPPFEYAGRNYRLCYLGTLTGGRDTPDLRQISQPLPVVLVRGADNAIAVQVDCLMGSREIVVKTLGPQFSSVRGLTGATVLGDGSVIPILDLNAMIRGEFWHKAAANCHDESEQRQADSEPRNPLVMVVDDSVTVRRVTSRFLERRGMDVLLAKDGVDAMQMLEDYDPDVMLLDIEMPRMDGFEVAGLIKQSGAEKQLPIIMITSRTGQKHRDRAASIGVDRYLGKPYHEMELLRNIEELIGQPGADA